MKETFLKIEEIILRRGKTSESIDSLKDIVSHETVKNASNISNGGFKHNPESYMVEFYNGSSINTLNSKPDNIRGMDLCLSVQKWTVTKARKKSGKLKCQSDLKVILKV